MILEIRDEFSECRLILGEMTDAIRCARSIHDAKKARTKLQSSMDAFTKRFLQRDSFIISASHCRGSSRP